MGAKKGSGLDLRSLHAKLQVNVVRMQLLKLKPTFSAALKVSATRQHTRRTHHLICSEAVIPQSSTPANDVHR